jgi:hypothetical protein
MCVMENLNLSFSSKPSRLNTDTGIFSFLLDNRLLIYVFLEQSIYFSSADIVSMEQVVYHDCTFDFE